MDKRPRPPEQTDRPLWRRLRGPSTRLRGQSDVIAIVLLFGMIFLGAAAVLVTAGALVDDVQGSSQHELAVDSALQTHQAIAEAIESGEARELAVSDSVDMEIQQSGSIAIEMRDGNKACSAKVDEVDPVSADMGAIVYDTPKGAVVYQGGAVWEQMDGGLSIERAPPISYDNETARISIQTVTAESDSFEGQMATPNESMQTAMAEETNRMLTHCPANGYTDLEISVTSPNYFDVWKDHFNAQITGPNVEIDEPDDQTVRATIGNATTAHQSRGLRFENVSGPTVVGPNGDTPNPNHFDVIAELANDDFAAREATVKLEIDGENESSALFTVNTTESAVGHLPGDLPANPSGKPGFHRNTLIDEFGLSPAKSHEYTLYLLDGENEVVDQATGRFFLEDSGGGNVAFFDDSHELVDGEDTLLVNATLINTLTENATDEKVEFQITDDDVEMDDPIDSTMTVPKFGGTKGISFPIDVSQLRAGTYEYELQHDGVTLHRNFTLHEPLENAGSIVGDVRVEAIDPASDVVEKGDEFEVRVQLYNTAANSTETDVSLALLDGSLTTTLEDVEIDGATQKNVTVSFDDEDVADLPTRTEHEYEITVEDGGEAESFPGTFVVLEPTASLQIDSHETVKNDDWRWINATLANHGNTTGSDAATLTLYDNESGSEIASVSSSDQIDLAGGNQSTLPFGFDVGNLSGAYDYEVSYGEETVEGYFSEGEADTGEGNVSITSPGNGTVTVLGTEVSYYNDGGCYPRYGCFPAEKGWAPTTVSAILEIDGEETVTPFTNTAADPSNYQNAKNLNTFDTQDDVYTYNWSQVEGESATLTVSSSYWSVDNPTVVNTRDSGTEDLQPGYDVIQWNEPANTVNANSGTNKEAVKVLTDGDEVPNPQTSGEDQRSAAEILNQGAADRIDDDGTLDLGPYEAVFLFELTEDAYPGMWDDADEDDGDPDYNDVIALVSFNPENPDDVTLNAGDHSISFGPSTTDPDNTGDPDDQGVDFGDATEGPGAGSDPVSPEPQSPDPGTPSGPDEINVDVGGIVIG